MMKRLSGATKQLVLLYVILLLLSYISLLTLFAVTATSSSSNHNLLDIPKRNERIERAKRTVTIRKRKAIVDECQASLVRPVSQIQQQIIRRRKRTPILQSMVPVDGAYRLIFITEHMKDLYFSWTTQKGASWRCDGQPAVFHADQHLNDHGEGGTLVITCPLTVQLVTGKRAGGGDVEYNTSVWRNCSDHDELQGIPAASVERMVCTMFLGDHFELAQWIEYHRLIGFQHFLIYLHGTHDVQNSTTLPDGTYITYIPWNFEDLRSSVMHQAVQQMDCIQRAQARNVTWVALHDVDEYFQMLDGSTLEDVLVSHESDEEMGGLQIPSWFFGENLSERTAIQSNETLKLVIESVWKSKTPNLDGREKMIIKPRHVVYFACHMIVVGGYMKGEPRIQMNHYRERNNGVFLARNSIVKDSSFQMHYGPILRERLKYG
ncbi:glycosyl transferase [Fragilaria crotonensis]|nr:glycosyl transferase [Fragilaria crotonensis]